MVSNVSFHRNTETRGLPVSGTRKKTFFGLVSGRKETFFFKPHLYRSFTLFLTLVLNKGHFFPKSRKKTPKKSGTNIAEMFDLLTYLFKKSIFI